MDAGTTAVGVWRRRLCRRNLEVPHFGVKNWLWPSRIFAFFLLITTPIHSNLQEEIHFGESSCG